MRHATACISDELASLQPTVHIVPVKATHVVSLMMNALRNYYKPAKSIALQICYLPPTGHSAYCCTAIRVAVVLFEVDVWKIVITPDSNNLISSTYYTVSLLYIVAVSAMSILHPCKIVNYYDLCLCEIIVVFHFLTCIINFSRLGLLGLSAYDPKRKCQNKHSTGSRSPWLTTLNFVSQYWLSCWLKHSGNTNNKNAIKRSVVK